MKKILGLDLGSSSIGWALVNEAEHNNETGNIIKLGVRIIPMGNELSEFESGQAVSLNATRRQKRGMRRNLYRYQIRRKQIRHLLKEKNLLPESEDLIKLHGIELMKLRADAATQQITQEELGRVLLLLNQKRGYKSNRKTAQNEADESDYLSAITTRSKELKENNYTVGQYLYHKFNQKEIDAIKGQIFYRADYEAEFEQIWDVQSKFYPDILTNEFKKLLGEKTLFYQRRLKSQKGMISKCRFEPLQRVIPKSSPLFQLFRIYEKVNNLVVTELSTNTIKDISQDNKLNLIEYLKNNPKASKGKILNTLKLTPAVNYELNYDQLEGEQTRCVLEKTFKEIGYDTIDILDFDPIIQGNAYDKQPYMQLWHILYSIENPENVINKLTTTFGFTNEQATRLAQKITFRPDYGNLSSRAIRKLIPYMAEGQNYYEACKSVGYNHSDSLTTEENEQRILKDIIPLIPKNELRNPIVEKVLNQMIHVVNNIITTYGRPDEIRVELARELKQTAKQRNEATRRISQRKKENANIFEKLATEFGIQNPTRKDINRYKLWEETNRMSLYSGKPISSADLFSAKIEVEHIIPRALYFDDSFQNKTLCESDLNKAKDKQTAWDYMQTRGEDELNRYRKEVNRLFEKYQLGKSKKAYLLMEQKDIPDDFINRQLKESQYIAKKAVTLLTEVCRTVSSSTGSVTDYLRHTWGLTDIMKNITLPKYRALGQTEKKEVLINGQKHIKEDIIGWSKRDDHRHHAIDALVVAYTSAKHIQYLNNLTSNHEMLAEELKATGRKFKEPIDHFTAETTQAVKSILISFKQNRKALTNSRNKVDGKRTPAPRGPLHEETVYGKIMYPADAPIKISTRLTREIAQNIINPNHKLLVLERLAQHQNNPKLAFKGYAKNPILLNGEATPLESVKILEARYTIRKPLNKDFTNVDKIVDPAVKKAVEQYIETHGGTPKKALANLDKEPVWLNKNKNIKVKRVTILAHVSRAEKINRGYVVLGNNHHMAIYEDENGKRQLEMVSLMEAAERRRAGLPVIAPQHPDKGALCFTLQINDMVIHDPEGELTDLNLLDEKNYPMISPKLYRVQKMTTSNSNGPYTVFRHHLSTNINDDNTMIRITDIKRFDEFFKIKCNRLGSITKTTKL